MSRRPAEGARPRGRVQWIARLWFRALAALKLYRRLRLLERLLDRSIPELPLPPGVRVGTLGPGDGSAYQAYRPRQGAGEFARRIQAGQWCFAAWLDGHIVSAAWGAPGRAWIEYLGREIALEPDEAYSYDLYTLPAHRGMGLTARTRAPHLRDMRERGYRRAIATLLPENASARNTPEAIGYRPIGWIGYVGIGPWRHQFCLLDRRAAEPAACRGEER